MNWNDVIVLLQANADDDYRDFSIKLSPGVTAMYGVRLPILKQIAKDVCKGDWETTLKEATDNGIEELMIQGYIIGFAKSDYDTLIKYVENFVKKIKVWSVCDTTVATFKFVRKEMQKTWDFLEFYAKDTDVWSRRFAAVMMLSHFINEEYIDRVLERLSSMSPSGYYAEMGIAWAIQGCHSKFPEKTKAVLEKKILAKEVQNKAIQKICESLRTSKEEKDILRTLKIIEK